jgi:hypothetical protein
MQREAISRIIENNDRSGRFHQQFLDENGIPILPWQERSNELVSLRLSREDYDKPPQNLL